MTRILFYRVIPIIVVFLSANLLVGQDKDLSLNEAISIALQNNPELLAAQLEVDARQARIAQAGARPNPELIIVTEDISGSGRFEGFDSSQTTAQLSQRFELGGKRAARRDAASLNRDVAEADLELKRREIAAKVRKSFFAVLLSQEQVRVMQDLSEVSKRFSGVVIERIQAGKIPPIDEVKAQAIVALAEIELTRSTRALESARYELAAVLGASELEFHSVRGDLPQGSDVGLALLMQSLPVEVKKAEIEIEQSKALLAIEKSKPVPDLTVSGGYRRLETTDDSAFVVGVSLPLPLFDRNKGAIEEAQKRIRKAEQTKSSALLNARTSLSKSFQSYSAARLEAESLRTLVVPANQTSFEAISEGYRLGKYGYLDVLEAQRSLFQSRLQLLRALGDIYASAAEIERITGKEILLADQSKEVQDE